MTQDNGFREKVKEVLHDVWIDKLTQDEATDRIVQLVRELVPMTVNREKVRRRGGER